MKTRLVTTLRIFLKTLVLFILIPLFLISLQYFNSVIYNFERNEPFNGSSIYNPYEDFNGRWMRANFHCHSQAWGGVTHGHQSPEEVYQHYYDNGYEVVGLSNYQQITPPPQGGFYIPTYEHGVNIKLNHHIVLNSSKPSFADFFLWQNAHQKQRIIEKLKENGGMIAIAHPELRNAFQEDDMWKLRGYDFIEVLNNYKKSFSIWDAALSSGNLCWILANDDSHDIYKENDTFVNWNMIGAGHKSRQSILSALRKGCHYGVNNRKEHKNSNFLQSARIVGNRLKVRFRYPADKITFIGDHGVHKKTVNNTGQAAYLFSPEDTYIRVKAETDEATLYLNPFFRYNGKKPTVNASLPEANIFLTILYRIQILLISSLLFILILLSTGTIKLVRAKKGLSLSVTKLYQKRSRTFD